MTQRLSKLTFVLTAASANAWTMVTNAWRTVSPVQADNYRPEMYYMRGPGPKWRAKHAHIRRDR
jgi:hypothetical protein